MSTATRTEKRRCNYCGGTIRRNTRPRQRTYPDGLTVLYHGACYDRLTHPDLCRCRSCDTDIH